MSFSDNLRQARKNKGLSQDQMAEVLGVSRQSVSKWESNIALPELDRIADISKLLGVTTDFLLIGSKEDENSMEKTKASSQCILIKSFDHKSVVNCIKVNATPILYPTKKEPKFILNGVDKSGIFGDRNTILGFYDSEESITKEIDDIHTAMVNGESVYELKHFAKVIMKGLSPRLVGK